MNKRSTRNLLLLALLTLLISSCTRSMASTPSDIEAIVKLPTIAATAEAALTADAQVAQQATQVANETAPLEEQPTDQTASDQPTQESVADLPTHTPTSPPVPTNTTVPPTLTPLPTSSVSIDPQQLYGAPSKNFNHSNWNTFLSTDKGDEYTLLVSDGALTFTGHYTKWDTWYHLTTSPTDAYIEMNVELAECADNDAYGFIFRSSSFKNNGYIVQFSCDGEYSLWRFESESPYTKNYLVPWTADPAINKGSYQANTIGAQVQGNAIQLYANDVLLTELPIYDNLFPNGSRVAAFISPWETQNFTYMINSLKVWRIQ